MMKDQDADMQGETIRVGMLHSKSGMMAISEVSLLDAGMMAIAEINVCEHSSSDRPWSD
ncbi:MAG: transporter substrate-binding protein, partial [Hormoscilla sp. GM102CHS1]|nr:transporter substrate-binding protein [Hormoscilla sp. GM102CHS1]